MVIKLITSPILRSTFQQCLKSVRYSSTHSNLTTDQEELRDLTHTFCKRELPPDLASRIDREDAHPNMRDLWTKLGSVGLHGITVPREYGGLGLGFMDHCLAIEAISQYSAAMALSYGAHSNLNINQLAINGTDEQKRMYMPKLIDGSHIGSLAMSETEAGSDVRSMKTKAVKKGSDYVINGSKFWITNGPVADVIIVYAKTDNQNITAFIVEKGSPGFSTGKKIVKMGMRGSPTGELIFEDCVVPETNILGGLGKGVYVLMSGLDYERLVLASIPLGIMQRACDVAFDYAHQRKQFGKPIAQFQVIQDKMAEMLASTLYCRETLYSVAHELDQYMSKSTSGSIHGTKSSVFSAKCASVITRNSKLSFEVAREALQILGGNGYTEDYETSRLLRDSILLSIGAGTNEVRNWLVGRSINQEYQKI